ncbi:CBS domain-containing protein [Streptomyces asoensis]|uniref:CBS domain-containing protein n=1 Tax=Streptomyces asoensis TaxID=249586 RepID=UPI0033CFC56C
MTSHTVGQVMTSDVVQARRTTSFKDLVRLLDRHHISGLPVVDDDDKVIGVLSGTDLVRAQAHRTRTDPEGAVTANDLMTTPAITVHPEQTVPEAARLMERRGVERLPVIDEEDRLVGIATRRDLLRVFLRTDDDIGHQVTEEVLAGRLELRPGAVTVGVHDGVVTLDGRVRLRSQVPDAVHTVWRLEGVVGVVNALAFDMDDCALPVPPATAPSHPGARRATAGPRVPARSGPDGTGKGPSTPPTAPGSR